MSVSERVEALGDLGPRERQMLRERYARIERMQRAINDAQVVGPYAPHYLGEGDPDDERSMSECYWERERMRRARRMLERDYPHLRAWAEFRGYPEDAVSEQVNRARAERASERVLYFDGVQQRWMTLDDLSDEMRLLILSRQGRARREQRAVDQSPARE